MTLIHVNDYRGQPVRWKEPKMDGMAIALYVSADGESFVFTKTAGINLWPQLKWMITTAYIPRDTIILGELHSPGIPATSVKTLMLSEDSRLKFNPFAITKWMGKFTRWPNPCTQNRHLADCGLSLIAICPLTKELHSTILTDVEVERLKDEARKLGIEGWVVKRYTDAEWFKIKPLHTIDAIIIGVQTSDSDSFKGGLQSIQVGVYRQDGTIRDLGRVGTGFTAEFRMSVNLQTLIGRPVEVSYDCLAGQGKLRFGRFERLRDDKNLSRCTEDQLL
jgi:hypothetical protein